MTINDVLELIKNKIEALNPVPAEYLVSKGNDNGFEELVPKIVEMISEEYPALESKAHYGHHFPDMDLTLNGIKYGLELKSRNNGSWDTNGNSVFESITDVEYEEIFILFGTHVKGIPRLKVKYKPYWQATTAINVTHSPRFKINMNAEKSVFKSSEEYASLREMNDKEKVLFLQNYLKENTTGVKWFVPQEAQSILPTPISSLEKTVREKLFAEVMVLFPQDFIRPQGKYERSSEYIISNYFYYSTSFRDSFSASGKWEVNGVKFPRMFEKLNGYWPHIEEILDSANEDFKNMAYASWHEFKKTLSEADGVFKKAEIDPELGVSVDSAMEMIHLDLTPQGQTLSEAKQRVQGLVLTGDDFKDDYKNVINQLGHLYFYRLLRDASVSNLIELLPNAF